MSRKSEKAVIHPLIYLNLGLKLEASPTNEVIFAISKNHLYRVSESEFN